MFAFFGIGLTELVILAVLGVLVAAVGAGVIYFMSAGGKDKDD
jgi:hypothetical protein